MKKFLFLLFVPICFSCHNKENKNEVKAVVKDTAVTTNNPADGNTEIQRSLIRPGQNLLVGRNYTDTVQFVEFINEGDYNIFLVKKNRFDIQLYGGVADSTANFIKDEKLLIQWKMDTVWEPEHVEFNIYECLQKIERIK